MPTIIEDKLKFEFPSNWKTSKFDDWSFYRNQYMRVGDAEIICKNCDAIVQCAACGTKKIAGTRGIDILAVDTGLVCWHVEIKDYRLTRVTNFLFLADEVALKVRDTHACLVAARLGASDDRERDQATLALACSRMRVVLHLEQPASNRPLLPSKTQRANVLQRLKQLVKAIDPRPVVVSMNDMGGLAWAVTPV